MFHTSLFFENILERECQMKQSTVMKKFLFVFNKNGGVVVAEYFNFPVLIKQILKEKNIKCTGYGTYFYNGAIINYILNDGNITDNIVPCKLNKKEPLSDDLEKYLASLPSFSKNKIKKEKQKKEKIRCAKNKIQQNLEKTEKKKYYEKANNFYHSEEWRRIRYQILREQGGKCQCCGRSAKDGVVLHVDHIVPLSKDWNKRLDKNNLQVLCEDCNLGKSNTDFIDWRFTNHIQ